MITHRITTITLNPAIDETAFIPDFKLGEVNRVEFEQSDPGGKGVNVASFLSHLGFGVTVSGFLGADNADIFQRFLADKKIEDQFIRIPGNTRVNIKVVDPSQHTTTDLNFPGALVEELDLEQMTRLLETLSHRSDWFVLSGSLPAGVPPSIYKDMVSSLKALQKNVVLDASGVSFREALTAVPFAIKPNIAELRELMDAPLQSDAEVAKAAQDLLERGIHTVVVSMGGDGALFAERGEYLIARPPKIVVKSTVGAGDAMVAGLIAGKLREYSLEDCARFATACSVGTLSQLGPRLPEVDILESLIPQIAVKKL